MVAPNNNPFLTTASRAFLNPSSRRRTEFRQRYFDSTSSPSTPSRVFYEKNGEEVEANNPNCINNFFFRLMHYPEIGR